MLVKRLENDQLLYEYREPGTERPIPYTQGQIFRLPFFSTDSVTGNNPTVLLRNAIGLAQALEQHAGAFFGNGARPGVVFTNDNAMPAEERERAREQWERMHRGADRAYRTAILPQGMKPTELGQINNDQAQFLESRQYQIVSIARYFRVPPHLVQDLTRATYSNIEQTGIDFVTHCIKPWAKRWAGAIYRDLIAPTLGEGYRAEFDTKWITMSDSASRMAYYRDGIGNGMFSHNESRAMEGLNPVEGGDVRFMRLDMTTVDRIVNPPAAPAPGDTFDVPMADGQAEESEASAAGEAEQVDQLLEGNDGT
jgi:HK97 family phage portal protein